MPHTLASKQTRLRGRFGLALGFCLTGHALITLCSFLVSCVVRQVSTDSKSSRADLESLLFSSDVVSLNMPLTPQTEGLIGAKGAPFTSDQVAMIMMH